MATKVCTSEKFQGLYIAGPMRGHEEFNFPAFMSAERRTAAGLTGVPKDKYAIYNPARIDIELDNLDTTGMEGTLEELEEAGFPNGPRHYLRRDCLILCDKCNAIYLLKGWEKSKGARVEAALADCFDFLFFYEEGATKYDYKV
jgi:hypothetical protein